MDVSPLSRAAHAVCVSAEYRPTLAFNDSLLRWRYHFYNFFDNRHVIPERFV